MEWISWHQIGQDIDGEASMIGSGISHSNRMEILAIGADHNVANVIFWSC